MSEGVNTASTLKDRIRKGFTKPRESLSGLDVLMLCMKEELKDPRNKLQKLSLGIRTDRPDKIILIVGATGSGKTTLINGMVNYIFGVDLEDSFRFSVIEDKCAPPRSKAFSQTDYITAYAFNYQPGMPQQYNYIIVDTPGIGDSRGVEQDEKMMGQLKTFLEDNYGIDQVDVIWNVVSSSTTRLTPAQKYIFHTISSMFGKNTSENICIMATFADGSTPPIKETLNEAGVAYKYMYKFNYGALFNSRSQGSAHNNIKSNWEMSMESMDEFFQKLNFVTPISLQMTKEVLEKRVKLKQCISTFRIIVRMGLDKMENKKEIKEYEEKKERKNAFHFFYEKFLEFLDKCMKFILGLFDVKVTSIKYEVEKCIPKTKLKTFEEVIDHYNHKRDKQTEYVIHDSCKIEILVEDLLILIKGTESLIEQLEAISMKPYLCCIPDHIDMMIENEKILKDKGWEGRVRMLKYLKQDARIVQEVKTGNLSSVEPDRIIKHLWDCINA